MKEFLESSFYKLRKNKSRSAYFLQNSISIRCNDNDKGCHSLHISNL